MIVIIVRSGVVVFEIVQWKPRYKRGPLGDHEKMPCLYQVFSLYQGLKKQKKI